MVQDALSSTVDSVKQAEQTTIQGLQGKADIQDVVQAIANAENALETVVAVRDTAIKAYQSIIQMTI
jgi:flagellar hook-basal body complex protein FliE